MLSLFCGAAFSASIQALVVDGQNNHEWKSTTPALQKILSDTGLFSVDVETSPPEGGDMSSFNPQFSGHGVVVLNYTGDMWNQATRDAFLSYVREGGGVVVVHAADNAFGDWKEYNEIIGFGGWGGRTKESGPYVFWKDGGLVYDYDSDGPSGSHEHYAEFVIVNRAMEHPILKGLPERWLHTDELYNFMRGPGKNMTILSTAYSSRPEKEGGSGRNEPMLVTLSYGKGRIFHTALGHDVKSMESKGFSVTFARGAEWAASGAVTIPVPGDFPGVPEPHDAFKTFNERSAAEPLIGIFGEIGVASGDPAKLSKIEDSLIACIGDSSVDFLGVQAACNALGALNSRKAVPALAALLSKDEQSASAARLALERISGSEAGAALIAELRKAGPNAVGVANSLGVRREAAAVLALTELAQGPDVNLAQACVKALAKIGNPYALAALGTLPPVDGLSSALVDCARNAAKSDPPNATHVFEAALDNFELGSARRFEALQGLLAVNPEEGVKRIWAMLEQPGTEKVALNALAGMPGDKALVENIAGRLDSLPLGTRIALVPVLGSMGHPAAAAKLMEIVGKSDDVDLKIAAIDALGSLPGNVELVKFLFAFAIDKDSPLAKSARAALVREPGVETDDAIIAGISESGSACEDYMKIASERNLAKACPVLLKLAAGSDESLRIPALNALKTLAGAREYQQLVDLVVSSPSDVKEAAVRAAKSAGRKILEPGERSKPYIAALEANGDDVKVALLAGLADIGGPDALAEAVKLANSGNAVVYLAAVDSLAHWRDLSAVDAILEMAAASQDSARRVALLNAFASLIAKPSERSVDEKLEQCRRALAIGLDVQGKRALLKALSDIVDERALEIMESVGEDSALADDVKQAIPSVKQKLFGAPVLTASHGNASVGAALDGDPNTRWTTGVDQSSGMWLLIDLRMRCDVLSVDLDCSGSPTDYPRGYEAYVFNNPDEIGQPVARGKGEGPITMISFANPVRGRYVKIVQTGEVQGLWWSVNELHVKYDPGFPEVPIPSTKLSDLNASGGMVARWNVSGPYMRGGVDGKKLFDYPFGPESNVRFAFWSPLPDSVVKDGVAWFDSLFGGDNRVAYLCANVVADTDCEADLGVGSDDGVKVWLNGELTVSNNATRPVRKDEDKASVHLNKGDNILLVKISNSSANWGGCVSVKQR
jgi:type 1 glutamine amidotransferase/HEAT repeat protein